ncbi:MAG: ATP-binding protein [Candidatus Diapherotrites archaeon]|nr:ATP-binding protein [Candidatus Diapherotrites archaeon]
MEKYEPVEIGTVTSGPDSPSPLKVDFVVSPQKSVHTGEYVVVEQDGGLLILQVRNLVTSNRYFERAESIQEFERSGRPIQTQFPTADWEYLVAETRPLGVYKEKQFLRPTFPPSPGDKIQKTPKALLEEFLGFEKKAGIHMGSLEFHDVPVNLNISKLLQKHVAILAMSGAGKSYLTSVLLEEILDRKTEDGRIATVIIDPHGEYSGFARSPEPGDNESVDYSDKVSLMKASDIRIGVSSLNAYELASYFIDSSGAQKRELSRIIDELKREMKQGLGPYNLRKIMQKLDDDAEINTNVKLPLLSWLKELEYLNLFSDIDYPNISDIVKPGKAKIVDFSGITDLRKKRIITSFISKKMFSKRRNKRIPPFLLVVEEAHQFVPEQSRQGETPSKSILETIAREGRKFGASLCLISQRPINLSTTILSQCNTHIILRITNPYDQKHIGESSEGIDQKVLDMITVLRVGEALIVGEAVRYPVFVKVRKRKSRKSPHEKTLQEAAIEFEKKQKQDLDDLDAFM